MSGPLIALGRFAKDAAARKPKAGNGRGVISASALLLQSLEVSRTLWHPDGAR
jgi:hypothetical protein